MQHTIRDYIASEVTTLRAGGPGSGCQGPNCGRKAAMAYMQKLKGLREVRPGEVQTS